MESSEFEDLRQSLEKLTLNDSSLIWGRKPPKRSVLAFAGFLGLLHMEIVQERLEREFDQTIIVTTPNVVYHPQLRTVLLHKVENPPTCPRSRTIGKAGRTVYRCAHHYAARFIGNIMKLCADKRGELKNQQYLDPTRAVALHYHIPLAEVVFDFFDRLKSVTRGYASLDMNCSATVRPNW